MEPLISFDIKLKEGGLFTIRYEDTLSSKTRAKWDLLGYLAKGLISKAVYEKATKEIN